MQNKIINLKHILRKSTSGLSTVWNLLHFPTQKVVSGNPYIKRWIIINNDQLPWKQDKRGTLATVGVT